MQVIVESAEGLERRLKVQIPEERVQGEVDKRLSSIAQSARLPGFRPGKAPMKVVAQRFGRQVREEVVGEMVQSSFQDAIVQEHLHPAGSPTIAPLEWNEGNGVAYTAVFDVYPEIELPPIESLKIQRPEAGVAEDDVDRMLERLRTQKREWRAVKRAATPGDRVVIDFRGECEGEARDDLKAEGFAVELGVGQVFKGFEDALLGAETDQELHLDLHFPSDYRAGELAGKPVVFHVKVHSVEEPVLPEVDDELARAYGIVEGGLEGLRQEVRSNMERELEEGIRSTTKRRVMEALLAGRDLPLPEALVKREVERAMAQRRLELAHSGIDPEQVALEPGMFEDQSRRRVSLGLLVGELIKENGIKPDPEKVRARIEGIASTYEQPQEVIQWYYSEPARLADVESTVLEDAVVDWILERADVSAEPTSFDALLNPGQTLSG